MQHLQFLRLRNALKTMLVLELFDHLSLQHPKNDLQREIESLSISLKLTPAELAVLIDEAGTSLEGLQMVTEDETLQ